MGTMDLTGKAPSPFSLEIVPQEVLPNRLPVVETGPMFCLLLLPTLEPCPTISHRNIKSFRNTFSAWKSPKVLHVPLAKTACLLDELLVGYGYTPQATNLEWVWPEELISLTFKYDRLMHKAADLIDTILNLQYNEMYQRAKELWESA